MDVRAGGVKLDLALQRLQRHIVTTVKHGQDGLGDRGVRRAGGELHHVLRGLLRDAILAERQIGLRQPQMSTNRGGVLLHRAGELRRCLGRSILTQQRIASLDQRPHVRLLLHDALS